MSPVLQRVAGKDKFALTKPGAAGEDFGKFAARATNGGLFVNLAVTPATIDVKNAASNHSPLFVGDDAALPIGVRVMSNLAVEYLKSGKVTP